jgi:hypothetical protein
MKKLAVMVLFFMLVGCTTTKLNPVFEIPKGSKIGVINLVEQGMKNYGVRFDGSYSVDKPPIASDIPNYINNEIKRQATEIGYKVEILEVNEDIIKSFYNGNIEENHQIVLSPETIPVFKKLASDHNLSIIYIIKEAKGKFKVQDFYVFPSGYGLAMDLAKGRFSAFAFFNAEAIYLDPVSLTRGAECLEQKVMKSQVNSDEFESPKGSKMVSLYDVSETIKPIISKFISDLLKNSNLKV